MSVHVTEHAIDRYLERIAPVGRDQARAAMQSAGSSIQLAGGMGGHTVRLGNGARLVLRGTDRVRVVTVLARGQINRADVPRTAPVCCGLCGLRCGHPIANACTRTECALGAMRRCSSNEPRP